MLVKLGTDSDIERSECNERSDTKNKSSKCVMEIE